MDVVASPRAEAQPVAPADRAVAIRVDNLGKRYLLHGKNKLISRVKENDVFWALRGISFSIAEGERVGIIGRNGAGKSTLLKMLSRVVPPTEGRAEIRGRVASLLEVGTGFNAALSGRENVYLNASLFGLSRQDVEGRLEEIIAFAEIGRFIDEPIRTYSTGMRARLGFAVAAHLDPDVLMLDEVLSVGDASFQAKCLQRVGDLLNGERTLLFVSHSIGAVRRFCDRCIWLDRGKVMLDGPALEVSEAYEAEMLQVKGAYRAPERRAAQTPAASHTDADLANAGHIISAAVTNIAGDQVNSVRIDEAFSVEVVFDVLEANRRVEPALHFFDEKGDLIFVIAFTAPDFPNAINEVGRHRASARVPGNFMNEGIHRVTVALVTADPLTRHEMLEKVLSFSVYERASAGVTEVARGRYARRFPGAVRPMLDWSLTQVS